MTANIFHHSFGKPLYCQGNKLACSRIHCIFEHENKDANKNIRSELSLTN